MSFFFVFVWLYCEGKGEGIEVWGANAAPAAAIEWTQMSVDSNFAKLLQYFNLDKPFKKVAWEFREVLWPDGRRMKTVGLGLKENREQMYQKVVKVFEEAVEN